LYMCRMSTSTSTTTEYVTRVWWHGTHVSFSCSDLQVGGYGDGTNSRQNINSPWPSSANSNASRICHIIMHPGKEDKGKWRDILLFTCLQNEVHRILGLTQISGYLGKFTVLYAIAPLCRCTVLTMSREPLRQLITPNICW